MTPHDALAALVRHGVLDEQAAAAEAEAPAAEQRPWYVSAMLGAAGWLASLCVFLFVMLLFEPDSVGRTATLGAVLLAAGFGLYAASGERGNAFLEQLALAMSLAGQICVVWASIDATDSVAITAAIATVMEVGMVLVYPNRFAKRLATFLACVAWTLTVRFAWWEDTGFGDARAPVAFGPALLGWAVIWLPIATATRMLIMNEARWMATDARRILRPALTGMLAALALATWVSEPFAALAVWTVPGVASTNWLAIWPLLAFGLALYAAIGAYSLRDTPLIGIAIAGALLHLVQFYYLIGVTLVTKAFIMVAVGVVLLAAARLLERRAAREPHTTGHSS